jgi:S1-C subfamily serine protease
MKHSLFAATAALALSAFAPATFANEAHPLAGDDPRFDYTMWLSPNLSVEESTTDPSLGYLERVRRMEEATVFIQNSSATTEQGSMGSGVIIDNKNCWAITNQHVTDGADFLSVTFVNGWLEDGTPLVENVSATIVGHPGDSEQNFDFTLLQMDHCEGAAWAPIIKDHTNVKVGETAIAMGNPMGQTWSVTTGTVSHTARTGRLSVWPMIQTDASVNPGNSGGPLFEQNGYVIGINTSILSRQKENNGIAFAGRSDLMRLFLNNVYAYGQMQVNQIGVQIGGISKAEAAIMDIPGGVVVSSVMEGTPADEAGIQKGDIITHVNGTLVTSVNRIIMKVWSADPEVGAHAQILRENADGVYEVLEMTIPVRNVWESDYTAPESESYEGLMGWTLEEDTERGGVTVTDVTAMGPSHRHDMEPQESSRNLPPTQREINGRKRAVNVSIRASGRMVITGVKAQGQAKLDLTGVTSGARIEALEGYIAGTNGAPVVLYINVVNTAEITMTRMNGAEVSLTAEERQKLEAKNNVRNGEREIVLYVQPKAYSAPMDLNNWTPPETGN